ncbi:hypothetical protein B0T26DRAFT_199604 [Lasiosphaeria miniovina]|uniref:Ubiquitin-like domain-containing protein n=1 Tax=Lasiosphaeria miniovina TaxID=1954250 RepID=A0AA40AU25_9PEZI|nr:uncharacterized protein B0T26DRAFT_199604 [Lasiosphaeria miniovina]KAK0722035.1 hypothetical protein B0T26DRAFT_199604 [Lasiosphaeria miniovina]
MGCCISSPSGPNSPYPGGVGASGSSRAINDASQTAPASSTQATNDEPPLSPGPGSRRRRGQSQPLAQHINKPLRRHEWSSRNRMWTRAALARERADFFETRVAGRQEIWQALRSALEVLWEADAAAANGLAELEGDDEGPSEEDPAVALATAQSIINAADITLPTGDLAQGAYDALGCYYSLPEHVVSDPSNLVEPPASTGGDGLEDVKPDLTAGDETAQEELDGEDKAERRREEKGKGVADIRDQITIRARLSDGSRDISISVGSAETVRSIARYVAEEAQLPATKKIRVAYMGKILKENSPLLVQGWKQGHVVNALVFNRFGNWPSSHTQPAFYLLPLGLKFLGLNNSTSNPLCFKDRRP